MNALIDTDAPETPTVGKTPATKSDDDILDEARKRYRLCQDADSDNRTAALADLNFLTGGTAQWDERAVAARTADGRPIITVNTLPTYLHQVTNDQRMNAPSIKVHPVDDGADIETAKVRQGMIKHIEYDSNADVATDRAVNSAAAIGFGYWRLVTEWESPSSMVQKIMYKSIRNALSVRIDPLSTEPDGSDMKYAFIESLKDRGEFKRKYPKASANSWPMGDQQYASWLTDSTVLVCDYYAIEETAAEVVLLSDGTSGYAEQVLPDGDEKRLPASLTVVKRRPGSRCKVMLYKITGVDVLERSEIKSCWIPVFPVYGDEIDIEGKVTRAGIIRNAKGPAQMYNTMITAATEEVGLRAKAPYIGAEGQFEGYEDEWEQANNRMWPFLEYKPVTLDGKLAPPPQRQQMADVPVGMLAMAMHARDNVKATTGLFDSSLGAKGTATSGIQEREQQQQGDMANFHYQDGLLRSLRHCGRCINYMIPHYYDTQRTIRILGEDNQADYKEINKPETKNVTHDDGTIEAIDSVLHDMSGGEYDTTVRAGASYSTMREENAEFFTKAMQSAKDPATASVLTYLAFKNQDAPGAEEATAMFKTLLPPSAAAVLDINKDKDAQPDIQTPKGPLPVAQVPQVLADLEQRLQHLTEALDKAGADKQQAEVLRGQENLVKQQGVVMDKQTEPQRLEVQRLELEAKAADARARAGKAEAERIQAEADVIRARTEAAVLPDRLKIEAAVAEKEVVNAHIAATTPPEVAEPKEPVEPAVTLEQIAALIEANKPTLPPSMVIRAPSGQVYNVEIPA